MQDFRGKCATYRSLSCSILVAGAVSGLVAACNEPVDGLATDTQVEATAATCGDSGFLAATLYGAIATQLDWTTADVVCEGMPRPGGKGARLRFAGTDGERQIAIIIALPALQRGVPGDELPSNVTLIEEGNGRFFSTPDLNNCWTDVTTFEGLGEPASRFAVGGTLYCLQPLAEVNGPSSVSLTEMRFRGLLDWSAT